MTSEIIQQLPPDADAVARARRAVEGLGLPPAEGLRQNLRLLVSELVTNSIRHAGHPDDRPILLRARAGRERVRVEVVDHGPGFEVPPGGPRPGRESGWGLRLVDALADRWAVERDRNTTVWFELRFDQRRS